MEHGVGVLGVKREPLGRLEGGDRHRRLVRLAVEQAVRLVARTHCGRARLVGGRLHVVVLAAPLSVARHVGDVVEDLRLRRFDLYDIVG
jgi:uncharacterized protein (DUF433 family)